MTAMFTAPVCTAAEVIRDVNASAVPVTLAAAVRRASLQTRVDTKYVVDAATVARWANLMDGELEVVEINARRAFGYESVYFDSPDHALFRQHRQGRRRRYKLRTRAYLDSGECQLEVKFKNGRGDTEKHRTPHPFVQRDRLVPAARGYIDGLLRERGIQPPELLVPALTISYARTTLLLRGEKVRVTCDTGLRWSDPRSPGVVTVAPEEFAIVEVKAAREHNRATAALHRAGARPVKVSKYCVGLALVTPGLHANPWNGAMKRYFDVAAPLAA